LTSSTEESIPCFIRKTYKILEDDKYSDIISWNPEGTAIIIRNPTEFAQTTLPIYFKHNNLNSFIRQLNMYDFHKKKTPDGEHVYYHELFQKEKKHLLKNIRRKNAESSLLNTEKSRLGQELVRTKQDIATIINENLFLKKAQNESITTINNLELKINELTLQNQALWAQMLQNNEKEEALRSFVPTFKREPFTPLTNIDITSSQLSGNNMMNKIAQTTTRIPQFSNQINWNFNPENYDGSSNQNLRNILTGTSQQIVPSSSETDYASDLSQQIVKNMDQELQYLKKLTSSNKRPIINMSLSTSPDSGTLRKRTIEPDSSFQNQNPYESLSKIYKPDNLLGLNLLAMPCKAEGSNDFGEY